MGAPAREVDQIGDDGGGGGRRARARAVKRGFAARLRAHDDGVGHAIDGGERMRLRNERGLRPDLERLSAPAGAARGGVAHGARDGEHFDAIAEPRGGGHVGGVDAVDAADGDLVERRAAESDAGEQGDFVRGVAAADIEARVGFGESQFLRQRQGGAKNRRRFACAKG